MMFRQEFHAGDWVVFRMTKHSPRPGPRAQEIEPAPHGEEYTYHVDKFWMVREIRGETLILVTRRGKVHEIPTDHPNLRRARWWERWLYREKFPEATQ